MSLTPRALVFLVALFTPAAALAQCVGAPVTATRFGKDLDQVEATVKKGDLDSLDVNMAEIALEVPCLSQAVATKDAARLHLLTAIQADPLGTNSSTAAVQSGLARYKQLLPGKPFPPDLLPKDHGVRKAFDKLEPRSPKNVRVPKPKYGHVEFDGVATRERPVGEPALFQLVSPDGIAHASTNLLPSDPLPKYDAVPQLRNRLWISAAGCALASAATFAGAWVSRVSFNKLDPNYNRAVLARKAKTTNALVVVSATFGTAALGLGAGGFVVSR